MTAHSNHRFQVDMRGLLDLLSHHLYRSPAVFVREMLQNGLDAITAWAAIDPAYHGQIEVEWNCGEDGVVTLTFSDDGVGLTLDEMHQFLSTIGESSKRGKVDRPQGFLGQFGIGLLSGFMVTDQIVVISQSVKAPTEPAVEWRGKVDGTYSVRPLERSFPVGTRVYLRATKESVESFQADQVLRRLREYGEFLPLKISFQVSGETTEINSTPPWELVDESGFKREQLLPYGHEIFKRNLIDAIPLSSATGGVEAVAFILAEGSPSAASPSHRVYCKGMLLSTQVQDLLPRWAFFVQCVANAKSLRPTASRESLYEDAVLEQTREELGDSLRDHLLFLSRRHPDRLQTLIAVHHLAIKSLALEDDECLQLFADWLPFETTSGSMTFGEFREDQETLYFARTRDTFRQLAPVATSQGMQVINAGYIYDEEILRRLQQLKPKLQLTPLDTDELSHRFEPLTLEEREEMLPFERLADAILSPFKCSVEIAKFHPENLPALYFASESVEFQRDVERTQEVTDNLWEGVLGNMLEGMQQPAMAKLYLNLQHPLVRRIATLKSRAAQQQCVETLYVQSLLLGHFPLKSGENVLLNKNLMNMLEYAVKATEES